MNVYLIFPLVILQLSYVYLSEENLREKLSAQERNALCCAKNQKCCTRPTGIPRFEIKTFLVDCPNVKCNKSSNTRIVVRNPGAKAPNSITNCIQKLLVTVKVTNRGITAPSNQYIIIDHVVEPDTHKKVRILNPYVVRLKQEHILQVYNLEFDRVVNAEAKETVHNKHNQPNYEGCDAGPVHPTCGIVKHEGKIVPFSAGFCCSCDASKNLRMQPPEDDSFSEGQRSQLALNREEIPDGNKNRLTVANNDQGYGEAFSSGEETRPAGYGDDVKLVYDRDQKGTDESANYGQLSDIKDGDDGRYLKVGDQPVTRQRRGGQSCDDINTRGMPEAFHESAHCLVFSSLWYSVYNLRKPRVQHKVSAQIFQKYEDCHGKVRWRDLNNGKVLTLGTETPNCVNTENSVIGTYQTGEVNTCEMALDYKTQKILIPEKQLVDPGQFMVIPKKLIATDGQSCNTAGVGYQAFYKQGKRCSVPRGSCLANQPQHFYDQDAEAERQETRGYYFLKFFGSLPDNPVERNGTGFENTVRLMYTKTHVSTLYFEIRADSVTLLQPSVLATITEVYVDATSSTKTNLIVKVTNAGLVYGVFYVRLGNCPMSIPAAFNNIASKSVLISPQQQHIFKLFIDYPLPETDFYCSIVVHNMNQELLAVRRIRFQDRDRCICMWHCQCKCYEADSGLKCTPLTVHEYQVAGFQGGLPVPSHMVKPSYLDELLAMCLQMFIILILTLVIMGLIKALLGLCSAFIGLWGLNLILGIEEDNASDFVCMNKDCEINQQNQISLSTQFCLNTLFFFLYPLALINLAIRKLCFSFTDEECECSKLINKISYNSQISLRESQNSKESLRSTASIHSRSKDSKLSGYRDSLDFMSQSYQSTNSIFSKGKED